MAGLYNLFLHLYYFGVQVFSLKSAKAKQWLKGRKEKSYLDHDFIPDKWIWFHCASLGEFDQGLPLMFELKKRNPDTKILVTFFSPSGMNHYQKRKHCVDFACYLPFDFQHDIDAMVEHVQPELVCIVKYEYWRNFIRACQNRKISVYSVSSIFRPSQVYFKFLGEFFRKSLRRVTYFLCQDEKSVRLLQSIGIEQAAVYGDLRLENLKSKRKSAQPAPELTEFANYSEVIVLGSTWPIDEEMLIPTLEKMSERVIIAPHDISESHLLAIEKKWKKPTIRFSQFDQYQNESVLILDTIGHLTAAYSLAKWAYVGGGFTGKLHNILEPLSFNIPVIFGPKHLKFPEASKAIHDKIGFTVSNEMEFKAILDIIHSKDYHPPSSDLFEDAENISARMADQIEALENQLKF